MTGYSFEGWNTAADGSGELLLEGDAYTAEADADSMVLYAQWEELEYSAVFSEDGTQVYVTIYHQDMTDVVLSMAVYSAEEQMLQYAEGVLEDEVWVFDIEEDSEAVSWKLFYLSSGMVPVRGEQNITFDN